MSKNKPIIYRTEDSPWVFSFNKTELSEILIEQNLQGFLYNSIQNQLKMEHGHYVVPDFDEEDVMWEINCIIDGSVIFNCWVSDCWNPPTGDEEYRG